MRLLSRLAALRRNVIDRRRVERELDDELRATLDMLVEAKLRQGMPPYDARRAAAIELGGLSRWRASTSVSAATTTHAGASWPRS